MDLLLAFVIAMVVTMTLIPPLMRLAGRLHVLDEPAGRKVHTQPIPRVGGIAMVAGALLPLCIWLQMDLTLIAYLIGSLVLLGFGAWDDRVDLHPAMKLAGQFVAVLVVVLLGDVHIDTLVLAERVTLPAWIGYPVTVLFLLGITNAINLSDGLDGLAGGTTLLCCAALMLLAQNWGVTFVVTVSVVLMGSILGFLRFNTHPARVFMGDAGSQFLGFSVGVLCILLTNQDATPLSTTLPLLLIGLPVLDTFAVMAMRLHEGRSPFSADRKHLHHRLLALGADHHEAVIVIYAVQCVLLLLAWELRFESDVLIVGAFLGVAVLVFGGLAMLEHTGWRWRAVDPARRRAVSPLARGIHWVASRERLPRWSMRIAFGCAAAYLLSVGMLAAPVAQDLGWLSLICLVALAVAAILGRRVFAETWLVRGALYIAVMVALYLDHFSLVSPLPLQAVKWIFLPLLAVTIAIAMRLSTERRFEATPLDLLLIFAALALPNLPGLADSAGASSNFGLSIAKLVALCYLVEMLAALGSRLRTALIVVVIGFNVLIAVRAF